MKPLVLLALAVVVASAAEAPKEAAASHEIFAAALESLRNDLAGTIASQPSLANSSTR